MAPIKGISAVDSLRPLLGRLRLPIIIAAGVLVVLVGAYFGYQWYEKAQAEKKERQQESIASWFGDDVAKGIDSALEPLDKAIDAKVIEAFLEQGDDVAVKAKVQELGGLSDEVMGVRIIRPGTDETNYEDFPPVSYAVLDLIRRSEEKGAAPGVEVHFKGEDTENIAVLRRVETEDGRLVGHLLIALKPSVLKSAIANTDVPMGYIELHQPVPGSKPLPP